MFDNFLNIDIEPELRNRILQTILIGFVMWLINKISLKLIYRGDAMELRRQYHYRKFIEYTSFIIGILIIGNLWIGNFHSVTTFLGLLSAGIAIALKDILIDLRLFQFSLLEIGNWVDADQSTGRVIHVPNGKVFMDAQANYSTGFNYIWNEQNIYITLRSDFKKTKEILLEILNSHLQEDLKKAEKVFRKAKQDHLIVYKQFTPMIFTKITERGVQLSMRYLCDPKKRRMFEHAITESILERLGPENNIRLAYPTSTVLLHQDKVHPETNPNR